MDSHVDVALPRRRSTYQGKQHSRHAGVHRSLGIFIAPVVAMLAQYGLLRLFGQQSVFLVALTGSVAFTASLFLQTFIGLVDAMLYDLAYDMTAE